MNFFHRHKRFAALLIIVLLLFVGSLITRYEFAYVGKFYPHTIIAGEEVGGKTYQEVFEKIQAANQRLETEGFTIQIASTKIKIPAFSQGLTPDTVVEYFTIGDWQGKLQKAYQMGRHGALFERIGQQLELVFSRETLQFPYTFQESSVRSLLSRELDQAMQKKSEARFQIINGILEIAPEVIGQTVNQDEIIAGLKNSLATFRRTGIQVASRSDHPAVTAKKLETILDFARTLAQQSSATVKLEGFSSYISGRKLATWLKLKDEPGISPEIDRAQLEAYVRAMIDPYVANAPRNSRFEMRDGTLVETSAGGVGQGVDVDLFYRQLSGEVSKMYLASAFGATPADAVVPIKFSVALIAEEPKITKETISRYGIKDLVGTVTTSFKGSTADRIHNIKTGLAKINGLLIAPGQEFSAVNAIGEVTEEEGYAEEYVIKGDASVKEFGGGLCQIATTLFRLALNAGLPITERQNHKYVVGYYGPGLDATIYGPHPDLKFVNDTKGYLLLQGRIVGSSLVLELYGQKDGRTATFTEPVITERIPPPPAKYLPSYELALGVQKCTEHARYGETADVDYIVTYPDGHRETQNFHSVYTPWAQVCLVGISTTAPITANSFEGVH